MGFLSVFTFVFCFAANTDLTVFIIYWMYYWRGNCTVIPYELKVMMARYFVCFCMSHWHRNVQTWLCHLGTRMHYFAILGVFDAFQCLNILVLQPFSCKNVREDYLFKAGLIFAALCSFSHDRVAILFIMWHTFSLLTNVNRYAVVYFVDKRHHITSHPFLKWNKIHGFAAVWVSKYRPQATQT